MNSTDREVVEENLKPTKFLPLDGETRQQRGKVSIGLWVLAITLAAASLVMLYLASASPVIITTTPPDSRIELSGISFRIGSNYLLLPGKYEVKVTAKGYKPYDMDLEVSSNNEQQLNVVLEPLPGQLQVESTLTEITALVDGAPSVTTLPGVIKGLKKGTHQIVLSKTRYLDSKYDVDIIGLGTTQTLSVELQPGWGTLKIDSVPSAAELWVDDKFVGNTPTSAEVLQSGSSILLKKSGFNNWSGTLSVPAGETQVYPPVSLVTADGYLQLETVPTGASMTLNGNFQGITPLKIPVRPEQKHKIDVMMDGYIKKPYRFTVASDQVLELQLTLQEDIGEIALSVSPEGAKVYVDSKFSRTGSQTLRLPSRQHELRVEQEGYRTETFKVLPQPSQQQALSVTLLTEEEAYWSTRPNRIKTVGNIQLLLMRPKAPFSMGAPRRQPGRRANEIERSVALQRPFYIGETEVSNRQFRTWKTTHSSSAISGKTLDMEDQPVVNVSWVDAIRFCNWLSKQDGLSPFYIYDCDLNGNTTCLQGFTGIDWSSNGYRLPTEAEWSWAARTGASGSTQIYPWGNDRFPPDRVVGNYADTSAAKLVRFKLISYTDGYPVSAPTGTFASNKKGLYNIGGNVAEWVNDYYNLQPHRGEPLIDFKGPEEGTRHVIRGASWAMGSRSELRLTYRDHGNDPRIDLGFRIARYVDRITKE
tara:strand:- start:21834 stop:23942 length:2109 start_codon:yes stop_codon:yes gene_type:complete